MTGRYTRGYLGCISCCKMYKNQIFQPHNNHENHPLDKTSPVETRRRMNMDIWLYMKVFRTSFDVANVVKTLWRHRYVNDVVGTSWKRRDVKRRPGNFHIQPITNVVSTLGFVVTSNDVLITYFAEWAITTWLCGGSRHSLKISAMGESRERNHKMGCDKCMLSRYLYINQDLLRAKYEMVTIWVTIQQKNYLAICRAGQLLECTINRDFSDNLSNGIDKIRGVDRWL